MRDAENSESNDAGVNTAAGSVTPLFVAETDAPPRARAPRRAVAPATAPQAAAPDEPAGTHQPELAHNSSAAKSNDDEGSDTKSTAGKVTTPPVSTDAAAQPDAQPEAPLAPLLDFPAEGVPDVVDDERRLLEAAQALRAGTGPVAVDAERASGYRYGQRAYLIQLRREGSGTWLIDPIGCPDLTPVHDAVADVEWVLHAATQDLPCLAEVGMRPTRLFDTELGARLAGLPRVGLAAVTEHYLGLRLAKEHSAVDWSTRPLPEPWLRYAALDVEVLVEMRDALAADLEAQGKGEWARQEFAHLVGFTGPTPRVDPWRHISGMHRVRNRRSGAVVRELWYARDEIARRRDVSPGRVVPDAVLLELAMSAPTTPAALAGIKHKGVRRHEGALLAAIRQAKALPDSELPPPAPRSEGPPPQRAWAQRDPEAAERLTLARERFGVLSEEVNVPVENLLSPDTLRRVLWAPPPVDADLEVVVADALRARAARPWQIELATPIVADAIRRHP